MTLTDDLSICNELGVRPHTDRFCQHGSKKRDFDCESHGPGQSELLVVERASDELLLHDGLHALDAPRRRFASALHGLEDRALRVTMISSESL